MIDLFIQNYLSCIYNLFLLIELNLSKLFIESGKFKFFCNSLKFLNSSEIIL